MVLGFATSVGIAQEAYKKELLQMLSIGKLGNTEEIEKYYIDCLKTKEKHG